MKAGKRWPKTMSFAIGLALQPKIAVAAAANVYILDRDGERWTEGGAQVVEHTRRFWHAPQQPGWATLTHCSSNLAKMAGTDLSLGHPTRLVKHVTKPHHDNGSVNEAHFFGWLTAHAFLWCMFSWVEDFPKSKAKLVRENGNSGVEAEPRGN